MKFNEDNLKEIQARLEDTQKNLVDGPWMNEPNRIEFVHEGFHCLIQRAPMTYAWCGYVGLPKTHPFYGKPYEEIEVDVHGGLTYAAYCSHYICHKTEEEDDLFWLGFDCAHCNDLTPGMHRKDLDNQYPFMRGNVYRDVDYVVTETKRLAEQLK